MMVGLICQQSPNRSPGHFFHMSVVNNAPLGRFPGRDMRTRLPALFLLAAVACGQSSGSAPPAAPRTSSIWPAASACEESPPRPARGWFQLQPGRPFAVTQVAPQPGNAQLVFAVTIERGLWRSEDGGQRFCLASTPGRVSEVHPSPADPEVVYARADDADQLLRSGDGGRTWEALAWPEGGSRLIVDPTRADTLTLQVIEATAFALLRSVDGGRTWTRLGPVLPDDADVFRFSADPGNPDLLYGSGPCGRGAVCLWRWSASAGSFQLVFQEMPGPGVPDLDFVVDRSSRLFRIKPVRLGPPGLPRLERSLDGGTTWSPLPALPDGLIVLDITADPAPPGHLYLLAVGDSPLATSLLASADGGESWQVAARAPFGSAYRYAPPDVPLTIASAPKRTFFVESGIGVFRVEEGQDRLSPIVLDAGRGAQLQVAPSNPQVLYMLDRNRLYRSADGGIRWQIQSMPDFEPMAFAIDPRDPDRLWGVFAQSLGNVRRGLYRSEDGGLRWHQVSPAVGLPDPFISDISIPRRAPDTIYLATSEGVVVSGDGGRSWRLLPVEDRVQSLAIADADPRIGYVADGEGRIFVTRDGFTSLVPIVQPPPDDDEARLLIDPHHPERLIVFQDETIHHTADGGQTWIPGTGFPSPIDRPMRPIFHPHVPDLVYLLGGDTLQVSEDGGATWHPAGEGLPAGHGPGSLAFDPLSPSTLWGTIWSGGIWRTETGGR
jgi:photosystem II stability/assembly factor-like uncharacterized protein